MAIRYTFKDRYDYFSKNKILWLWFSVRL